MSARRPLDLRAESIGQPVALSSLARMLLRLHQPLRLVAQQQTNPEPAPREPAAVAPSRPVPAVEQGPR
jgi:hypothetical protein